MKTKNFSLHTFALCILFTLGSTIITLPFCKGGVWQIAFFAATSIIVLFLANLLSKSNLNKIKTSFVLIAATFGATTTFLDFLNLLKEVLLPRSNTFLLSATLLLTVIFFSQSLMSAIYKYSLFVTVIAVIFFAICFLSGIKNLHFFELEPIFSAPHFAVKNSLISILPITVLPFLLSRSVDTLKPVFWGVVSGYVLILLVFFQSILTLGSIDELAFPYLKTVSVISSGLLFTRLDGAVYFIFFITTIIKITVCIKSVQTMIKNCGGSKHP